MKGEGEGFELNAVVRKLGKQAANWSLKGRPSEVFRAAPRSALRASELPRVAIRLPTCSLAAIDESPKKREGQETETVRSILAPRAGESVFASDESALSWLYA